MRFRQWAGGVLVTSPRLQRGGYLVPRLGFFRFSTISWFRVGGGEDGAAAADAEALIQKDKELLFHMEHVTYQIDMMKRPSFA